MRHAGCHPQRAHKCDHAYEYFFVSDTKALPSFLTLTNCLFLDCRPHAPHGPLLKPASRPLTFEQVFNPNNYFNVVEILDNKFRNFFVYSQTYRHEHQDDVKDSVGFELDTEFYTPEAVLDDIEKDRLGEWLKFVINIGKVDGKGPAIYQCLHHIENKLEADKNGRPVQSTCNYKGAKQTVKRHVNSVHFGRRPWVCERCFKAFNQKSTLDIHINARHTQIKPHKCRHCPESFTDPAKRHKHCLKDHPDIPMPRRRKAPYKSVSSSPL